MKALKNFILVFVFILSSGLGFSETKKMKLAILELEPAGVSKDTTRIVSDLIRTELFKTGLFDIVERGQIEQVLKEQKLQLSGVTGDAYSVKLGELLSAQKVMVGTVGKLGSTYVINARIIDVEKGVMEFGENSEVGSESDLSSGCREFAYRLASLINGKPIPNKKNNFNNNNNNTGNNNSSDMNRGNSRAMGIYLNVMGLIGGVFNIDAEVAIGNKLAVGVDFVSSSAYLYNSVFALYYYHDETIPLLYFKYYMAPFMNNSLSGLFLEIGAGPWIWSQYDDYGYLIPIDSVGFSFLTTIGYQFTTKNTFGLAVTPWLGVKGFLDSDYYDPIINFAWGINAGIVF